MTHKDFTIATGHSLQKNRTVLDMPATLHIMHHSDEFGWRIQVGEEGELIVTKVNHETVEAMVIRPHHSNQVSLQ